MTEPILESSLLKSIQGLLRLDALLMALVGLASERKRKEKKIVCVYLLVTQVHDWAVYKLSGILGSVGHRVKIHKITPAQGKERGDLEIRDYVVL
jgi:hypothetical protein